MKNMFFTKIWRYYRFSMHSIDWRWNFSKIFLQEFKFRFSFQYTDHFTKLCEKNKLCEKKMGSVRNPLLGTITFTTNLAALIFAM